MQPAPRLAISIMTTHTGLSVAAASVLLLMLLALPGVASRGLHASPAQAAPVCTNSWTGSSGDGFWTTAGNWTAGRAPGSSDDACINVAVTVILQGDVTVNSLTVGAAGANLDVAGSDAGPGVPTRLTAANGIANDGGIRRVRQL